MSAAEERREPGAKGAPIVPPPPGSIADKFKEVLPDVEFEAGQGVLDVVLTVSRQDVPRVMQAAKDDPRLAFDYLRCLSGIDQMEQGLEVVYNLYSFKHAHNVTIKTLIPADDPQVPTATTVWNGALWHERETHEMFGIVFQGHPDLRPLLLEEGLGYHPLLKAHPLAEIEESQEDFLRSEAPVAAATAAGALPAPVDEKAARIALAQKKAEVMKKAREEARAKGLSPEDEKAFVQEALKAVEAEAAPPPATPAAEAPSAPADEKAARIALAQKKAEVMKKAREEARAKGLSPEDEKAFVQEALKALEEGS
ncbi:MAG TPA: NADH-quinone oxidoreductase subunit C [Dehalococcoidia bacterium]|nr:NADH-quinone oxidoreductase subunit C [Dehalococcoidia bacterium]